MTEREALDLTGKGIILPVPPSARRLSQIFSGVIPARAGIQRLSGGHGCRPRGDGGAQSLSLQPPHHPAPGRAGFTLIEVLAVIMILGFLVGMVLPFAGHLDHKAKAKRTVEIFEEIRRAVLGARGATDARGLPVIGGYVGDCGHLPRLYIYEWNNGQGAWTHPDADGDALPDSTSNNESASSIVGDENAQPAGLWCKSLARMDDGSGGFISGDLHEAADADWKGPYMAAPRDAFEDDQVYSFIPGASAAADLENNRRFCLRACAGRLSDGWGQAFLIFVEDTGADTDSDPDMDSDHNPLNLVFVSPGPDGRYDAADPSDLALSGNADNLVFTITRAEWDQTARKISQTTALLEGMARGIVGPEALNTGGELMRTGFIADMGDPGPLCGSVVEHNGSAYRCIKTHSSSTANQPAAGGNTWWQELSTNAASDYPLACGWQALEAYYASTPGLLLAHEDHVTRNGIHYRCIESHTADASSEPGAGASWSTYWEIDNSIQGPSWSAGTDYFRYQQTLAGQVMIPAWEYLPTCQMGAGWRGPYIPPTGRLPLADAWGNAVEIEMDGGRNLTLRSRGPDGPGGGTSDDVLIFIPRSGYELPLQINVADYSGTYPISVAVTDMVDIYAPYNGQIRLRRAWPESGDIGTGPGGTSRFRFNDAVAATGMVAPVVPALWDNGTPANLADDLLAPIRSETAGTPSTTDPGSSSGRYARTWLPVGRCYIVFRDDAYGSAASGTYGSPSPVADATLPGYAPYGGVAGQTGPAGYQKSCLLHPGTDTHVQLGP